MPKNLRTANKEPSIIYMFTTVCLNKYQDYKKGVVYEFFKSDQKPTKLFKKIYGDTDYQEVEFKEAVFAYAHRSGATIDPSKAFHWQLFLPKDYRFHFKLLGEQGMYSCKVPRLKKILGLKIKIPTRIVLSVEKDLVGSQEAARLDRELKAKILAPFALLESENKKVIDQFSESIHYALYTLAKLCKMTDVIELQAEIDKVNELLWHYYEFALSARDSLRNEKAKEMKEFLEKHHSLTNSLSSGIKQLTDGSNDK